LAYASVSPQAGTNPHRRPFPEVALAALFLLLAVLEARRVARLRSNPDLSLLSTDDQARA
jgi:hypothetical protein